MSDAQPDKGTDTDQVDSKLLELLVCPLTKGPLKFDRKTQELISFKARLAYPIREGIPIMLPEEARALTDDELKNSKGTK